MMSDEMLSQDEIDALLRGTDDSDFEEEKINVEDYLSLMEQDALGEIGNISFGSSATALSTLLNQKVEITTPNVTIVFRENLADEFPHPYVAVQVKYTEGFKGTNLLVIKESDAAIIADLMLGGDGTNPSEILDEIQLSAVQEAMNQMMGSSATSMSTIFSKRVDISPPSIDRLFLKEGKGAERIPADGLLVKISFRLTVGTLIDSQIMQLLPIDFAKNLVTDLLNPQGQASHSELPNEGKQIQQEPQINRGIESQSQLQSQAEQAATAFSGSSSASYSESTKQQTYGQQPFGQQQSFGQQQPFPSPYYGMGQQQTGPQFYGTTFPDGSQPTVQPAVFSSFEQVHLQESESKNLNLLLDIPLQVTVELGRTKRSIKDILELSPGSIIELDKLAGEPVDILVNNRLIAKGEVVVIDENFGVRVTDIISQSDRIKKLR